MKASGNVVASEPPTDNPSGSICARRGRHGYMQLDLMANCRRCLDCGFVLSRAAIDDRRAMRGRVAKRIAGLAMVLVAAYSVVASAMGGDWVAAGWATTSACTWAMLIIAERRLEIAEIALLSISGLLEKKP